MAKTGLELIAEAIPLPVYQFFIRREVAGFLYHVVSEEDLPHIRHLYRYKNISRFMRDLDYLQEHFSLISYAQFQEIQAGKRDIRAPMALLSFDDGFAECFSVIRPLLLKRGIPGIFFVNSDGIDNRVMLYRQKVSLCIEKIHSTDETWRQAALVRLDQACGRTFYGLQEFENWIRGLNYRDRDLMQIACQALEVDVDGYLQARRPYLTSEQIRILAADGFTIGAHTRGHPKLNLLSPEEMEDEIAGSCRAIQEITRQNQIPFAFPFSAFGLDRDLLEGILARQPVVGMLFDAKGLRKDRACILNRIMADRPLAISGRESDLPNHLRLAYQDVLLSRLRRLRIS